MYPQLLLTPDAKYIIVISETYISQDFGGMEVYDIDKGQIILWHRSIKLPDDHHYSNRAIISDDFEQSHIIINGYLRNCWEREEFKQMSELPLEIIDMLTEFYSQQYVHIMDPGQGNHCKALLSDILHVNDH